MSILFDKNFDYLGAIKVICETFKNIKLVIITLGEKGSFAYDCRNNVKNFCPANKVDVVSTVGAGDSFSAAFLSQYLLGAKIDECLTKASKVSAFVVSKTEAIPDYESIVY